MRALDCNTKWVEKLTNSARRLLFLRVELLSERVFSCSFSSRNAGVTAREWFT